MRVGVISPVSHGSGASCVSLLIALRLAQGTDRVCLTHIDPNDTFLRDASGVGDSVDRSTTPSMIINTFKNTVLSEQEYTQYCAAVTRDVDLFTCTRAGDAVCSIEDSRFLAKYVAESFPHKHVVIDADDHCDESIREVIDCCDALVFVARVAKGEIQNLRQKIEEYKNDGILSGKRIALVFNRYHSAIISQKELASLMGIKPSFMYCLDFNEYVAWASFNLKFPAFWDFVTKGDCRVIQIRNELDKLIKGIRQQRVAACDTSKEAQLLGVKTPTPKASISGEVLSDAAKEYVPLSTPLCAPDDTKTKFIKPRVLPVKKLPLTAFAHKESK